MTAPVEGDSHGEPGSGPDGVVDEESVELTVPSLRAARPPSAPPTLAETVPPTESGSREDPSAEDRQAAHDGDADDAADDATIVVPRRGRSDGRDPASVTPSPDDDTIRAPGRRRTGAQAPGAGPDAGAEGATTTTSPAARVAYSPDPALLREPMPARFVAPVIAQRAPRHASPPPQPPVDGEAVDRSVRGRARRRAVALAVSITVAAVVLLGLLAAVIASLAG